MLLNGVIQLFQRPERAVGFFSSYRETISGQPSSVLTGIADEFQNSVEEPIRKVKRSMLGALSAAIVAMPTADFGFITAF
jgi:hypothetical protein